MSAPRNLPPCDLQAEIQLLGALLVNNFAARRIAAFLRAEHFADPAHGLLFEAISDRIAAGRIASAVTLQKWADESNALEELGGPSYLAQLADHAGALVDTVRLAETIKAAWLARHVIDEAEQIAILRDAWL